MKSLNKKNQLGLTLITSLIMLLMMTLIGVTAVKLSSIDLLVAHNYQQQLEVYQEAETKIRRDVSFYRLHEWMINNQHPPVSEKDNIETKAEVMDLNRQYPCKGTGNLANSLGPDAPACRLFMFSIDANMKGAGAREHHYQGAGKQFPNQSKGSYY